MGDFTVTLPTDAGLREAIGEMPGVKFVVWDLDGPAPVPRADIVVPPYWGGAKRLARVAEIETRLVQWQSIGFDAVQRFLPAGVRLANATSVHETSTAELVLALTLASQRNIPGFVHQADAHVWQVRRNPSLADRRVLLIGYGGVGKAVDARLAGFEVDVTRVARTARRENDLAGNEVEVHALSELSELLPDAEIVILTVPLTDDTRGLLDAERLEQLPDGALVVNVARGPVVDTDALVAELQAGRLRAAVDVADPEPLPADHPLWDCPGTLITPHVGGESTAMLPRMSSLIRRQIERLRNGEEPENIVL